MIEQLLRILKRLEFTGSTRGHGECLDNLCPICGSYEPRRHKPDCELKAVIKFVSANITEGNVYPQPIPVSERLPELESWDEAASWIMRHSKTVLYCCGRKYNDGTIKNFDWSIGVLTEDMHMLEEHRIYWMPDERDEGWGGDDLELVTHWMPLPPSPADLASQVQPS